MGVEEGEVQGEEEGEAASEGTGKGEDKGGWTSDGARLVWKGEGVGKGQLGQGLPPPPF